MQNCRNLLCCLSFYVMVFSTIIITTIKVTNIRFEVVSNCSNHLEKEKENNSADGNIGNDTTKEHIWKIAFSVDDENYFVYSSYFDNYNNQPVTRIIAITPSNPKHNDIRVFCKFFDKSGKYLGQSPSVIEQTLCTVKHFKYSAAFIICPLEFGTNMALRSEPKFVSVMIHSHWPNGTIIPFFMNFENRLKLPEPTANHERNEVHEFGLCLQPIRDYDAVQEFIQWVEFYRMMGVTFFTFYNTSIGPHVSCVMNQVYGKDLMEIKDNWHSPTAEIHHFAQISQTHDCVFRHRDLSKYLVMVDLDEYIIPNPVFAKNYSELVGKMRDHFSKIDDTSIIAQFQFRGGFFSDVYQKRSQGINASPTINQIRNEGVRSIGDLIIHRDVVRPIELWPYNERSKFITTPKLVVEPGVHAMDLGLDGSVEKQIPPEMAYLYHYRYDNVKDQNVYTTDTTARFYTQSLFERFTTIRKLTEEKCSINL